MEAKPVIVGRETRFSTPWFDVIAKTVGDQLSDDREPYFTIRLQDYVTILALTPAHKILLVKQYRPVVEDYSLELPSGHVEEGESPSEAAVRELFEETGYTAREVHLLGTLTPDVGRLENRLWCYFADDLVLGQQAVQLEGGLKVLEYERQELLDLIVQQKMSHALDLAVIALAIVKNKLGTISENAK